MSSNIPRRLEGRNPRSAKDQDVALRIIEQIVGISVSERSHDELRAVGIVLPRSVKVSKLAREDAAIGAPFLIEHGLILSDNVILTCAGCREPIQFRPHLAHVAKRHLCIFCAADNLLREYWKGRPTARP